MHILKNKPVRLTFGLLCGCFVVCSIFCLLRDAAAGIAVFLCGAVVCGIYLAESKKRYRRITETSEEIDKLLHGEDDMDLSFYSEGELEILHCEIRKLVEIGRAHV